MKKSCKDINICNPDTVYLWIFDCVKRHIKRGDFKKLLIQNGMKKSDYYATLSDHEYERIADPVYNIAIEACKRISNRELDVPPIKIRERQDKTTFKIRPIANESAMRQVFNCIAYNSCMEIWKRRIVPQQVSSIAGRGQIKGVRMIKRMVDKDRNAMQYAKRHDLYYSRKCQYHVKLDAKKCYPNANKEIFLNILRHDCGNKDIIWLWEELLRGHHVKYTKLDGTEEECTGFIIGAVISMWAMQTMLSFVYRYAMELSYTRRNKKYKIISHAVFFMDDILLLSGNRSKLHQAVEKIRKYAKEELGIELKANYSIKDIDKEPIDMMGFVVHANGKVTMRARNFVHSRRLMLRYHNDSRKMSIGFARRCCSYKGYYKYSDSKLAKKRYRVDEVFTSAAIVVSLFDKSKNEGNGRYESILSYGAGRSDVYATA